MSHTTRSNTYQGFTIVELVVVVAVIGILAAITIVGYGAWHDHTILSTIQSDLNSAVAAMEGNINFQTSYPASASSVYTPSSGNTINGGAIGSANYCVSITNTDNTSMFASKSKIQLPGTCPMLYIDPMRNHSYSGSGTTISDLSGNGNDAIMSQGTTDGAIGPTYVSSDSGGVFQFDGVAQTYHVTNTLTFGPNTTWTACVKTLASANTYNMFMGSQLPYFGSYTNGTSIIFSNYINSIQRTIAVSSPVIPLNTWNCYAFTTAYDGTNTTMSIYRNGAIVSAATYPGAQSNVAGRYFTVGDGKNPSSGIWYPFNGMVGDVGIYNRTFSAPEVSALFELLRSKYGL